VSKKPANPQTVAMMAVGATAAVGFAVWNGMRSLAPPAPVEPRPTLDPTTPAGGSASAKGAERASGAPPKNGEPGHDGLADGSFNVSEDSLAPTADPFTPLSPSVSPPQQMAQGAPGSTPLPGFGGNGNRGPTVMPAGTGAGALAQTRGGSANSLPFLGGAPPLTVAPRMPAPPPILKEPELVGTLLGERPSAVFRAENHLVMVPVGAKFQGWRLIAVEHGEAVVRGSGKTLRLSIGLSASADVKPQRADSPRIGWSKEGDAGSEGLPAGQPASTATADSGAAPSERKPGAGETPNGGDRATEPTAATGFRSNAGAPVLQMPTGASVTPPSVSLYTRGPIRPFLVRAGVPSPTPSDPAATGDGPDALPTQTASAAPEPPSATAATGNHPKATAHALRRRHRILRRLHRHHRRHRMHARRRHSFYALRKRPSA
jgi:hypothetical protein